MERNNLSKLKSVFWRCALKFKTNVHMVCTRMDSFVPFFIAKETNTCILGRMYFVECSMHLNKFHRGWGFRSNHRLFIMTVLFHMVQIIGPHSSKYIFWLKKQKNIDSVQRSYGVFYQRGAWVNESFFFQ